MPAKPRHRLCHVYNRAVTKLEQEGFTVELWVKDGCLTLRWTKQGAMWHISKRNTTSNGVMLLNEMGHQALQWCTARAHGTANEENYAVKEL